MAALQPEPAPTASHVVPPTLDGEEITLRLEGVFDGASAWELRHRIEKLSESTRRVVLDFAQVREIYDFGVAVLAYGLAQRQAAQAPIALKGLRTHQLRMFRYFGVDAEH